MEAFYLDNYLKSVDESANETENTFESLCLQIAEDFLKEWDSENEDAGRMLDIQKRAIIGHEKEVHYFKSKISSHIRRLGAENVKFPPWYESLVDGVYHENWGMAGIAEWFLPSFSQSSSAKIIGSRIYFLEDGVMRLKEQRISPERREQLVRAFLLLTPAERLDRTFHEVYMLDGTRITVFRGDMTKAGEEVVIFRRYIIPRYSFEEQAQRGTIPNDAISMFKAMVGIGYNVAFCGAVRSAKTTFLSTWQSAENPELEGVMVETDPEIPLHQIMPDAPIVQLIADHDNLKNISKNLLRSDGDYFILAEARDGLALDTAIRMARKGTRRMKMTFHTRDPRTFAEDAAVEIVRTMGGDIKHTAERVAGSFDYVFHFIQLKKKNKKRLSGIFEIGVADNGGIAMTRICSYDFEADSWNWHYHIGEDKRQIGKEEDLECLREFDAELKRLARPCETG